jgi:voltage-gated potassium channel
MIDAFARLTHVVSLEEVGWGILLIAATMILHAIGMVLTLSGSTRLQARRPVGGRFVHGILVLVAASWMIVIVHLVEVVVWAGFYAWRDAMPNVSAGYYYALLQYTTVGSDLSLPVRWQLLAGMNSMAGLLTFAWSTSVLLTLAQRFQDAELRRLAARGTKGTGDPGTEG